MAKPGAPASPAQYTDLDDELASYAIDSASAMKAYLDRNAALKWTTPEECPRILVALARVARIVHTGCSWLDGDLRFELSVSAASAQTVLDVYSEGGGVCERLLPTLAVEVSLADLDRSFEKYADALTPLKRIARGSRLTLVTGRAAAKSRPPAFEVDRGSLVDEEERKVSVHDKPTLPVPASTFTTQEPVTKSGKHKKQG